MKHIFLLLAFIGLSFAACKKSSPSPEPPPDPTINAPIDTTGTGTDTTGNGNGTDTTAVSDTIGKVRIRYCLQLAPLTTHLGTLPDYVQDTTNVKIYHNTTQLRNHFVSVNPSPNNLGLTLIENGAIQSTHTESPIWCAHGDSIVIVFNHLEYNNNASNGSQKFCRMQGRVFTDYNTTPLFSVDTYDFATYTFLLNSYIDNADPYIGKPVNGQDTYYWQLGGQYRIVYHIQ